MIHDPALLDKLGERPEEKFSGRAFRCTGLNADPRAFSYAGGRWAPPDETDGGFPVLYTSLDRQGSLAEVVAYLRELTPIPKKPLKITELRISAERIIRLSRSDLASLEVNLSKYTLRDYRQTAKVGAAINFLGFDGFIVPSARWNCDNLILCGGNLDLDWLEEIGSEHIDWQDWHRLLDDPTS
jgi:hypothetical protein